MYSNEYVLPEGNGHHYLDIVIFMAVTTFSEKSMSDSIVYIQLVHHGIGVLLDNAKVKQA